jgi:hypothetical protein
MEKKSRPPIANQPRPTARRLFTFPTSRWPPLFQAAICEDSVKTPVYQCWLIAAKKSGHQSPNL